MGAALSSQAQWTSASGKGSGKLEFTPQNEALLNSVLKYVETLASEHPREAEVVFKEPFTWHSNLKIQDFTDMKGYEVR